MCAQEKVPMNLYEYALGAARTRETDLYQARGYPDAPPELYIHIFTGFTRAACARATVSLLANI